MGLDSFICKEPNLEDYWRGIILFGRNVASYKFALAKSLLDIKAESGQLIKLTDLAPYFAGHIAEHLKHSPKQATSASSKFLDACKSYAIDSDDKEKLVDQTVRLGFNNVIDAFHIVGAGEVPKRFYIDERSTNQGIRITDEFSNLLEGYQSVNLLSEVESRWRLVETAWELGISKSLLTIQHCIDDNELFAIDKLKKRKAVTSSRSALNGYQRGKCFYCRLNIRVDTANDVDVDHFFPHKLKQAGLFQVDGIWNLVLACKACNRGDKGKFDKLPKIRYLSWLFERNEYLIGSHHPLRETLIQQTGLSTSDRKRYLNDFYEKAKTVIFHSWSPLD